MTAPLSISYSDFLARLGAEVDLNPCLPLDLDHLFIYAGEDEKRKRQKTGVLNQPLIIQYWESGGVSGGSCWESSDPQPYTSTESPPPFTDLDKVLAAVVPNLTFLQYRLLNEIIHHGTERHYEYYGNRTDYAYNYVLPRELFDKLVKIGLIREAS